MKPTTVVERVEIIFDDFRIMCPPAGGDNRNGFLCKNACEELTHGVFSAPVNDGFGDRCTHQLVVERQPIRTPSVDREMLFVVSVNSRVDGEIVLDDLRCLFETPVVDLLIRGANVIVDSEDVLAIFE